MIGQSSMEELSSRRNNFIYQNFEDVKEVEEMDDLNKCKHILDLLIEHGMDLNLVCYSKYTPFLYAVKLGNLKLINFLLQKFSGNIGPN